jgi:hypothetical protein
MKPSTGCLFVAFGEAHLVLSLIAIRSLKEKNGDLSVQLITNVDVNLDFFDFWDSNVDTLTHLTLETEQNRLIKTNLIEYTVFDKTLFIDSDALINDDISKIFEFSEKFDLGIKLNWRPQTIEEKSRHQVSKNLSVGDFSHWNSGVILFTKNASTTSFFTEWRHNFVELGSPFDQPSLAKTLYSMPDLRFISLDERWNSSGPVFNRQGWSRWVKIFHYTNMITPQIFVEIKNLEPALKQQNINTSEAVTLLKLRIERRRKRLGFLRNLLISFLLRYNGLNSSKMVY